MLKPISLFFTVSHHHIVFYILINIYVYYIFIYPIIIFKIKTYFTSKI